MNDLIPLSDVERMAKIMGTNSLFGKTSEQMLPLMLLAQAEGRHPAIVAMEYDIISGKPALNSRAALARFQAAGGRIEWRERTDARCESVFSRPQGGSVTIAWDMARAKAAGLTDKPTWRQYPRQMLSARVIAEGVRACYPACLLGFYTVEEVQDMDRPVRNVTPDTTEATPDATPETPATVPETPTAPELIDDAVVLNIDAMRDRLSKLLEDPAIDMNAASRGQKWLREDEKAHDSDALMARIKWAEEKIKETA